MFLSRNKKNNIYPYKPQFYYIKCGIRGSNFRDDIVDTGAENPASILYKSTAGRYRPVSYPDGPITARCRVIKNAYWERCTFSGEFSEFYSFTTFFKFVFF